tara:strand:- start:1891 stop:3585 length:1695 start_codon:yes stop_codon:yes gene_type:complete
MRKKKPVPQASAKERLKDHLRFTSAGQILLFDQRMLLMHGFTLATLRRELVERLGLEQARELFTRMGYRQGIVDAQGLRNVEGGNLDNSLSQGPHLREMEGFVRNQAIASLDFNTQTGEFWGNYYWEDSWEAGAHLEHFGISGSPACWMMTGYACGFSTTLMGRPIVWQELECIATGHERCHVIGQPLEEGEDIEKHLSFLQIENFVAVPGRTDAVKVPPAAPLMNKSLPDLLGASTGFNDVAYLVKRVGPTDATVLLLGESGVGKERFAKTLHSIGPRSDQPLISINCAAIPNDLVESELFGVEKGAFTGATQSRPGRFERANGGTLFLDEIASLPLPAQGKLLRVLQEGEVERVGDTEIRHIDVRIIAAANRDLRAEVAAGRFREDLFFRLNVFPITIPPLRERRDDIPLLTNVFVKRYEQRFGKKLRGLSYSANQALQSYQWPGNIRELENIIERGVILADDGGILDVQHLFNGEQWRPLPAPNLPAETTTQVQADTASDNSTDLQTLVSSLLEQAGSFENIERLLLEHALTRSQGNISAAARHLKLRRAQFEYRIRKQSY